MQFTAEGAKIAEEQKQESVSPNPLCVLRVLCVLRGKDFFFLRRRYADHDCALGSSVESAAMGSRLSVSIYRFAQCSFAYACLPMKDTLGVLLAGGAGERLYPLTRDRAKPAVTFGGNYRIIDVTLSNC